MRNELNNIERVESYILGNMGLSERIEFEKELNENIELRKQVEQQKLIIQVIKRNGLKKEINNIKNKNSNLWKGLGGSLLLIISVLGTFLYFTPNQTEINIPEIRINTLDTIDTIQKDSSISEKNIQTFHGLKTFTPPIIQRFTFMADTGITIEGNEGTLIIVPNNAFIDKNENPINGKVTIELVEALYLDDMVLYNLTTLSNKSLLETGGMIHLNATQNNEAVFLKDDKPLYIEIPTMEVQEEMKVFDGVIDSAGNINWINPKELSKYLVKLDFDFLDFLPEGFEDSLNAYPISSIYHQGAVDKVYEEYYKVVYDRFSERKKQRDIDSRKIKRDGDSGHDPIESCGINPLAVKAIRTNQFKNTFLATKEFEDRLKVMHQQNNGQQIMAQYIKFVNAPMHKIDRIIADKFAKGHAKKIFEAFEAKKHTNVENDGIHQQRLSDYYNRKLRAEKDALQSIRKELLTKERDEIIKIQKEISRLERQEYNQANNIETRGLVSRIPRRSTPTIQSYGFKQYGFGWINIDQYLKYLKQGSIKVPILVNASNNVQTYQYLNLVRSLIPLSVENNESFASFPKKGVDGWRKMERTYAFSIDKKDGLLLFGEKTFNPYKSKIVTIEVKESTEKEARRRMRQIDNTHDLFASMKTLKEIVDEELELSINQQLWMQRNIIQDIERSQGLKEKDIQLSNIKKKEQERIAYESKLNKICFPCYRGDKMASTESMKEPEIFAIAEEMPEFPGGVSALMFYLSKNIRYPALAVENNVEGTVIVTFVVSKSGQIISPTISRGIGNGCDEEALRVIQSMPNFTPGKQRGKNVSVQFSIPVKFKLS